jgi:flagellar biosynthesis/type III secretory pathway protein FliH
LAPPRALALEAGNGAAARDVVRAVSRMASVAAETRGAQRAAPELAGIAVDIARALVGEAVSRDPAVIASAVSEALARFTRARRALVRVHPEDEATARAAVAQWVRRVGAEAAEVVADTTVARGGVRLETDRGRLDATLETRLAALEAALQGDAEAT